MVLSDADLEVARAQFYDDTGETLDEDRAQNEDLAQDDDQDDDQDEDRAQEEGPEEWDEQDGGGRRSLSLGALGLLALTVVMACVGPPA